MRLHRFIGDFDLSAGTLTVSDSNLISQWRTVLRLKTGDALILSDGNGSEAEATILAMDKQQVTLSLAGLTSPKREPAKATTLYCALLKRENFELVAQKATEIGISRIVPLLTERTVKTGFNRERLEKIVKEAAEQSGRTTIPDLAEPILLEKALAEVSSADAVLFDLSGSVIETNQYASLTSCFIGPEGGFSDTEVVLARTKGLHIGSLGGLTLRGETAAIVAAYLLIR